MAPNNLTVTNSTDSNLSLLTTPYVKIVEEPVCSHRFRYYFQCCNFL
jgi:hypothetical protein